MTIYFECNFCGSKHMRVEVENYGSGNMEYNLICLQCHAPLKVLIEKCNYVPPRYISREIRYEILNRQKWCCNRCGCKLKWSINSNWQGEVAHTDHIHPYSKAISYPRGAININESINIQALCPKCNKEKWSKEVN